MTTGGLYLEGQMPFDIDNADGDPSFRALPSNFDPKQLRVANPHWPHARFNEDHNVVMPIDRLRTLVERGVLGGLAPNFYSFGWGGGITKGYLDPQTGTAHQAARLLAADRADFALFVPT